MAVKKKRKASSKKKTTRKKTGSRRRPASSDTCFTIMPFGGWFDDYYESVFCPAIEAAGLTPKRADDLYRPSTIVHDIWDLTKKAKIILADLSGKNPNVFYELGLAHAVAKPAILVTESMDDVPFDLRALRVIEYDKNDPNWGVLLSEKIENAIQEVLDSPTQSVLPAFLDVSRTPSATTVSEKDKEIIELRQEMNRLSREVRVGNIKGGIHRIGPEEAEALINTFLDRELSKETILSRLSDRGVPLSWAKNRIDEIVDEREKPSSKPQVKKKAVKRKTRAVRKKRS